MSQPNTDRVAHLRGKQRLSFARAALVAGFTQVAEIVAFCAGAGVECDDEQALVAVRQLASRCETYEDDGWHLVSAQSA